MGEHRIQVRVDDPHWELANEAASQNGLRTVSGLVGLLLQREFERLGLVVPGARKKKRARVQKPRPAR
jgi:hypothetical protein